MLQRFMMSKYLFIILVLMILLLPSVQGMFLPNPFYDAPSHRDRAMEGPYWRELIHLDMPLRRTDMYIYNIMATTNGDLFLVGTDAIYQGYTDEGVSDYSRHGYIARMSKDGELVWDALIGDDLEFFDCEEVSDGIFLVLGRDIKNQDKNGIVLFAFGEDGTLLWKKAIESETDDSAFSMVQDGNGHLYLAGVSDTDEGYDGLFMKLDTEGDLIWKRAYDDGRHEMFTKIALSEDGDLVLLGTNKWLEFLPNSIPLYSEALVVSFDTDGNLRWAVSQGSGSDYTVPNDIDIGPDGIIAITGRVSIYREKEDILSLLIDMEGNILDCRSYPGLYEYDDYGYDITWIKGGGFVVFGESYRIISSQEDPMLWWYQSDSFYSIIGGDGEIELVSRFFGDAPSASLFRFSTHTSIVDQDGRIFLVLTSWGSYEVYVASLLGETMIMLDMIASLEFPSWREKLIS